MYIVKQVEQALAACVIATGAVVVSPLATDSPACHCQQPAQQRSMWAAAAAPPLTPCQLSSVHWLAAVDRSFLALMSAPAASDMPKLMSCVSVFRFSQNSMICAASTRSSSHGTSDGG